MREIFYPFPHQRMSPSWLAWNGSTIPKLARGIFADRAFDRLPIAADALEDAGCSDAQLLRHCREAGAHLRGCWALDLMLGETGRQGLLRPSADMARSTVDQLLRDRPD
jgi:hypothetical protein